MIIQRHAGMVSGRLSFAGSVVGFFLWLHVVGSLRTEFSPDFHKNSGEVL